MYSNLGPASPGEGANTQPDSFRASTMPSIDRNIDLGPLLQKKSVVIIQNPSSGLGKGLHFANLAKAELEQYGIKADIRESKRSYDLDEMVAVFNSTDVVLIAGGDGTVMALLPVLAKSKTPFYMMPCGNESLLARAFGMVTESKLVFEALRRGSISDHYFGKVNGTPFFTMMSLGLDSEVVQRIASYRNGPIGHGGYVWPTLQQLRHHTTPAINLSVDGKEVLTNEKGYLIIANSPEYAGKLDMVPEADSKKQELCARFFPNHSLLDYADWLIRYQLHQPANLDGTRLFLGKSFELSVENKPDYPMQADGDFVGITPAKIAISDESIRVVS